MSFFNKIFGSFEDNELNPKMEWNNLNSLHQLNEIDELSKEKSVIIFKHSTRCSISRFALKQFEKDFSMYDKFIPFFLDLLEFRNISNEVASKFQVVHQSPQIIVIKNGRAVYNASHDEINVGSLQNL